MRLYQTRSHHHLVLYKPSARYKPADVHTPYVLPRFAPEPRLKIAWSRASCAAIRRQRSRARSLCCPRFGAVAPDHALPAVMTWSRHRTRELGLRRAAAGFCKSVEMGEPSNASGGQGKDSALPFAEACRADLAVFDDCVPAESIPPLPSDVGGTHDGALSPSQSRGSLPNASAPAASQGARSFGGMVNSSGRISGGFGGARHRRASISMSASV